MKDNRNQRGEKILLGEVRLEARLQIRPDLKSRTTEQKNICKQQLRARRIKTRLPRAVAPAVRLHARSAGRKQEFTQAALRASLSRTHGEPHLKTKESPIQTGRHDRLSDTRQTQGRRRGQKGLGLCGCSVTGSAFVPGRHRGGSETEGQ